jgi:hypothetical protein
MKHEWKKHEKRLYLPKTNPEIVDVPELGFFCIHGEGNPNSGLFSEAIGVLYSLAYAVRMGPKQGFVPEGYFEYTVYPLEGVWDVSERAKESGDASLNKDELVYDIMIRQPEFITDDYALEVIERTKKKKPHKLLDDAQFITIREGKCIQMMHIGPYDDEPESFQRMEEFCKELGLKRQSKVHREIYISDFRKTEPEKLKTVLRFKV